MALANVHIGFTYLKEGNLASAMSYLETARQQQPDFADTYKFLGHTLAAQGKEQEAIENLSRYLDLHPNALDAAKERKFLEQLREKLKKPTTAS
jgi:tetratricopeptide (TPR) repeat protein